ncbi:hypothetical protein GAR05_06159 [Micromonospora saelicesensis]|uniref:Uncharacterized protein n=1 Tax=Micromonospora saelicesensis TaxID=285676 RepID=A0ABX9CAE6_9ACTN|nr:hypothetical protein [Micromonospora saelicesensis]RAN92667.1 hypothetical protein GAR05_06159 [Micromonospora saelicesensis]
MTRAPANLLAVRSLLITHLDNAPGPDDLDPGEVGIVGDSAHRGGYHCGSDRVVTNDYSVVESSRDRAGLSDFACALDVGQFSATVAGKSHNLRSFSVWLAGQCKAGAADTKDIREVIYSPDGSTVKRWDRLGKRTSGDSSHRWHTHISYHRDAIKAGRDQTAVMRRYLTMIGLLKAPTVEASMTVTDDRVLQLSNAMFVGGSSMGLTVDPDGSGREEPTNSVVGKLDYIVRTLNAVRSEVSGDPQAVVRGVLEGLTPDKIAAAIPPTMAKQVADELARRLVGQQG